MRPDVDGLVMDHKQAPYDLAVAVKVNSISCHYVIIVQHVLVRLFICSDEVRFFHHNLTFFTLLLLLPTKEIFVFQFSWARHSRTSG